MLKNVIIIGAGIGGLATAAKLAREGFRVTVFEKTGQPGGCCGQIRKDGHYFDTGPTFFVFPDVYKSVFSSLGERIEDYIDLIRVDPNDQIIFDDGFRITIYTDLHKMYQQLEKVEQGSSHNYFKYLLESEFFYKESMKKIICRDFTHIWEYISLPILLTALKVKILMNHYQFIGKFFRSPYLKAAFTFQDFYAGLSPSQSPATFSMFPYSEFTHGIFLPKGGMQKIAEALFTICKKNGVIFKFNTPVGKILTDKKHVTGISTADGREHSADLIVSDADLSYVYNNLLPTSSAGDKLRKKRYSSSVLSFYWATKKKYPELQTHNLFLSKDYCGNFEAISGSKKIPNDPHIYVHCASRTDPGAAPKNQDSITAIIPVGHIHPDKPQDWNKIADKLKKYVIKRFKLIGIKDLEKNIKFEMIHTPDDFREHLNLSFGSTLGLQHDLLQMGYFRSHRQHEKYKNLYFVGSNTHPGAGVPTVLLSAQFTASRVCKDFTLN